MPGSNPTALAQRISKRLTGNAWFTLPEIASLVEILGPRIMDGFNSLLAVTPDDHSKRTEHLEACVMNLEAEVRRLTMVARNANVSVQAQTESLQQFLSQANLPDAIG
jgi:hypothetical protein